MRRVRRVVLLLLLAKCRPELSERHFYVDDLDLLGLCRLLLVLQLVGVLVFVVLRGSRRKLLNRVLRLLVWCGGGGGGRVARRDEPAKGREKAEGAE